MLSFFMLLTAALANNYFLNPSIVDVYDAANRSHNIVFTGTLDAAQCQIDEILCEEAVVTMTATFTMEPNEEDLIISNSIMMCSDDKVPAQFSHANTYHYGESNCAMANDYFKQQTVAFDLPLPEPKVKFYIFFYIPLKRFLHFRISEPCFSPAFFYLFRQRFPPLISTMFSLISTFSSTNNHTFAL